MGQRAALLPEDGHAQQKGEGGPREGQQSGGGHWRNDGRIDDRSKQKKQAGTFVPACRRTVKLAPRTRLGGELPANQRETREGSAEQHDRRAAIWHSSLGVGESKLEVCMGTTSGVADREAPSPG